MSAYLSIDLVNFGSAGLGSVIGKTLKHISWPERQLLECTWRLEIVWEGGTAWTVQSVSTMTESGHEMGSLRVEESFETSLPQDFRRLASHLDGFALAHCRIASASESGVTSDCAIALIDDADRELVIATAPSSGAVTLWRRGQPWPRTEFSPSSFVWRPGQEQSKGTGVIKPVP